MQDYLAPTLTVKYPQAHTSDMGRTLPEVEEKREEADAWRIEWEDGSSRETTLAGIAVMAEDDPEAEVTPL